MAYLDRADCRRRAELRDRLVVQAAAFAGGDAFKKLAQALRG